MARLQKTRSRWKNIKNDKRSAEVKAHVALERANKGEQSRNEWFAERQHKPTFIGFASDVRTIGNSALLKGKVVRDNAKGKGQGKGKGKLTTEDICIPMGEAMQQARKSAHVRALARVQARALQAQRKRDTYQIWKSQQLKARAKGNPTMEKSSARGALKDKRRRLLLLVKLAATAAKTRLPRKRGPRKAGSRQFRAVIGGDEESIPGSLSVSSTSEMAQIERRSVASETTFLAGTKVRIRADASIATVLTTADGEVTLLCGEDVRTVSSHDIEAL